MSDTPVRNSHSALEFVLNSCLHFKLIIQYQNIQDKIKNDMVDISRHTAILTNAVDETGGDAAVGDDASLISPRPGLVPVSIDRIQWKMRQYQLQQQSIPQATSLSIPRNHGFHLSDKQPSPIAIKSRPISVQSFEHWPRSIDSNPRVIIDFKTNSNNHDMIILPNSGGWSITCGCKIVKEWQGVIPPELFTAEVTPPSIVVMTARQLLQQQQQLLQHGAPSSDAIIETQCAVDPRPNTSMSDFHILWNRQVLYDHFNSGVDCVYRERGTNRMISERSMGPDRTLSISCFKDCDNWSLLSISYHMSLLDLYIILCKSAKPSTVFNTIFSTKKKNTKRKNNNNIKTSNDISETKS